MANKEVRILALLALDTVFFLLEIIIGYAVHSLALVADAFHMLNDIFSLIVALWAVRVAKSRGVDSKYTYGWQRAEILGALINAVFLIALCMTIFLEAIQRLIEVPEITNPQLIAVVGTAGLISNILGLFLFHEHGHSHGGSGHSHSHDLDDEETIGGSSHSHSHGGVSERDILGYDSSNSNDDSSYTQKLLDDSRPLAEALPSSYVSRISESSRLLEGSSSVSKLGSNGYGSTSDDDDHSHDHSHTHPHSHESDSHNGHNRTFSLTHSNHFHVKAKSKDSKSKSLNMEGVFLHVLGDALGNIGVIATAIFIWKTDYSWKFYMDPIISLVITAIIFSSALPLCRRTSAILLQAVPQTVNADEVKEDIVSLPGVHEIHELHIWILREDLYVATLHVSVSSGPEQFMKLAHQIRTCMRGHGIASTTIQPEFITKSKANSICSHSHIGQVSTGGLHAVSSSANLAGQAAALSAEASDDSGVTPACVLQGNHTTGGLHKANNP